ncbi:MAG: DUF3488 and DUF4129 domain-containing transglutaminase family protein [Candidatus Methylumidiphilus sp.]
MQDTTHSLASDRQKIGLLLCAVLLVAVPHAQNLAPSVMAYFGLLAGWRMTGLYFKVRLPGKALLFALTLAGLGVVLGHYRRVWGQEAGSSLFIVGLGLKLMELKTLRDAYLVIFLAFFVALTQYLFSQSIPMAAYTLAVVVLLVAAMVALNSDGAFPLRAQLRLAALLVAQAFPAMVLLFVFFPRVQGPLWQLPDDRETARSGLSDTITPGAISRLALSQETAFRVDFEGEPPPPRLRYWRGPVFWATSGGSWRLPQPMLIAPNNTPRFAEAADYAYMVTLEPHNKRWIFALDLPKAFPDEFEETTDYQLLAKDEVRERKQYRLVSGANYTTGPLGRNESQRALQLPGTAPAPLRQLVASWQQEAAGPKALVERALRYFREEPFYYTLDPPPTTGDPTASFVLETRRGFCEHYATAFVVLMRLGGVPARVVTGYQGGQWNPVGRFLEVKQADAHAWAEVWLEASGWTRVDPTAAVAPERIERGLDVDTQVAAGEIRFNLGEQMALGQGFNLGRAWHHARLFADSVEHAWDSWVLAYGLENQGHLLQWLGLVDWRLVLAGLGVGLAGLAVVVALLVLPRRQAEADPAKRAYGHFVRKLAKRGLVPMTGEGAQSFAERVADAAPDLAEATARITRLYLRIRYERRHTPADLRNLRRWIKAVPDRAKP